MPSKTERYKQITAFEHVFEPPLTESLSGKYEMRGKWNSVFFNSNKPIVAELGCGRGEYTIALARKYPAKNFIGIDIKGARIWQGAKIALDENMKNVAFIRGRIDLISSFFAENELDEIWLTFPDPQLKKPRKRLSAARFSNMYHHVLKPDAIIHLKTDSVELYKFTKEMIALNKFETLFATNDLYQSDIVDDILDVKTYYENMFLSEGKKITYLKYCLTTMPPYKEPPKKNINQSINK